MDAIDIGIKNGELPFKDGVCKGQTWNDFFAMVGRRRVVLYGAGAMLDVFLSLYAEQIRVNIVVDGNPDKQGRRLREISIGAMGTEVDDLYVTDINSLLHISDEEIIVLITMINGVKDVYDMLYEKGITCVFSFAQIESEKRIVNGSYGPGYADIANILAERVIQTTEIEKKKIYCKSFGTFSEHPKYITKKLIDQNIDVDIVWEVSESSGRQLEGIRFIETSEIRRIIYEIETAHILIVSTELPSWFVKRAEQVYINTTHWSSITLKKFYMDVKAFEDLDEWSDKMRKNSIWLDYIITGSDFDTITCRSGYRFNGDIIQVGSCRSDALFDIEAHRNEVKTKFGISEKTKIMIYAPTYRFNMQNGLLPHVVGNIEIDYKQTHKALEERFSGDWIIMLRLHPSVAKANNHMHLPDFVIDASLYEDSMELVAASDGMISDYSSILFEPAHIKLPVFLFATDRQTYVDEYEFLIDYDSLPFPIAENDEKLVKNIMSFDQDKYENDVAVFFDKYGVHEDGHASERATDFICDLLWR